MPFTDRQILALRPREQRYEMPEPGRTGLAIRVGPRNDKIWTSRYRFQSVQKRLVLGQYPALSLADVRVRLAEAQKVIETGHDPGAARPTLQPIQHPLTVEEVVDRYLQHAARSVKPKTAQEDRRALHKEVLPVWRGRRAMEITRRDIMELLKGIEDRKVYVMRNRVAGLLTRFFSLRSTKA